MTEYVVYTLNTPRTSEERRLTEVDKFPNFLNDTDKYTILIRTTDEDKAIKVMCETSKEN
jgi:hypothetical protein